MTFWGVAEFPDRWDDHHWCVCVVYICSLYMCVVEIAWLDRSEIKCFMLNGAVSPLPVVCSYMKLRKIHTHSQRELTEGGWGVHEVLLLHTYIHANTHSSISSHAWVTHVVLRVFIIYMSYCRLSYHHCHNTCPQENPWCSQLSKTCWKLQG